MKYLIILCVVVLVAKATTASDRGMSEEKKGVGCKCSGRDVWGTYWVWRFSCPNNGYRCDVYPFGICCI
uniref:mRNA putative toxin n=1 Tax=Oulactis sp. TaxID=2093647 RepID=A0A4D8Y603_OULSP|nr:mRNA putative toxin [Oulactis sp. MM-2018]